MTPFELAEPRSLREAIGLLDPEDSSVRAIAGGTAVMLMMKSGFFRPRRLVSLRGLESGYSRIEIDADGSLRIGALAPLSVVERSRAVRDAAPVIAQTLKTLSNVRVRNVATIGGHLAHADPHTDLPPVLVALGARITVVGAAGERSIAVADLGVGYYETVLKPTELITELIVPPQGRRRAAYFKCTTRAADDWPALGVAVAVDTDGAVIHDAKIVISAATDKPTRLLAAETVLRGASIDDALLRRAGEAAADEAAVIGDQHGSAAYKQQLVRVYVERALRQALATTS
ncbi:MAG: FAD binding domain-containing protein, partial [Betaproteobacteria bacterium]|nr:FAD binding domain-containing protein [Betaproteobacteria bacterium]